MLKKCLMLFLKANTQKKAYSSLPNKQGGRLLIFLNFSNPPGAYLDPPFIFLGNQILGP